MTNQYNPHSITFDELYSELENDYGDDTMPRWKARRLAVSLARDYPNEVDVLRD